MWLERHGTLAICLYVAGILVSIFAGEVYVTYEKEKHENFDAFDARAMSIMGGIFWPITVPALIVALAGSRAHRAIAWTAERVVARVERRRIAEQAKPKPVVLTDGRDRVIADLQERIRVLEDGAEYRGNRTSGQ